ncbi:MAG: nitrite/sulfite reductase [Eubacteriales bacterium]|nr:nitrite/sulfite reductase [Eubacteriales bacterium]
MGSINIEKWKQELPEFRQKTNELHAGTFDKGIYKGYSGRYGSYAQKGAKSNMLRLRLTGGRLTKEKLGFIVKTFKEDGVKRAHFTTCESIQLHDLNADQLGKLVEEAWDAGMITMGGGGDYPRNIMCSPLSGVEKCGLFDVMPYAEAAGEFLLGFIDEKKLPRKLKVCFSDSPENVPHATYRDLGFTARPDGKFDVYSAGGLGNCPKFGVLVAEGIEPQKILYYIKAMWLTFSTYGDYENRGKARTRYMQDACGGPEGYKKAYLEKLAEVIASGEDLDLDVKPYEITKTGDGSICSDKRAIEQKQEGLYAVKWHPAGGNPAPASLTALYETIKDMDAVEIRIAPDETAYIINLTGAEAERVIAATPDSAATVFETSVSCIGSSTCQVGVRDSQALLKRCIKAVAEAGIADGALPQICISGCPSSCTGHQTAPIGMNGAGKKVDGVMQDAFLIHVGGCHRQGEERMGEQIGTILTEEIPEFLVKLGRAVEAAGLKFEDWYAENADELKAIAKPYLERS